MQITDVTNMLGVTNTKQPEVVPPVKPVFDPENLGEKKVLYAWESPARTAKTINKKLAKNLLIIGLVLLLLLVPMREFGLIFVIVAAAFLSYVLKVTPPETLRHEVSSHGLNYGGNFYYWNDLLNYSFTTDDGADMMTVDTKAKLPGRLFIMINSRDKDKLNEIFNTYLPYVEQSSKDFMEKTYTTIVSKISFGK